MNMAREFNFKTFDECLFGMNQYVIETFRCNTSKEEDITIHCETTECLECKRMASAHPRKTSQLRRMYVDERELDRACKEYRDNGRATFRFRSVQHEYDHIKGGCLVSMELEPDHVNINLRASVIPWNLQFDLPLIDTLLREMGQSEKPITMKIGYIRTKVIHLLLWLFTNGWTPEQVCQYRLGRSAIHAYGRAKNPSCKWRNWIRFAARVDKVREEKNIPELLPFLQKWEEEHSNINKSDEA